MKIVIFGLAVTSSWGNGHATTYRSLCKALARRGHRIEFVEKDTEWYRGNRDMPRPEFCTVHLYDDWRTSKSILVQLTRDADAIVIGSYFPDAISATRELLHAGCGPLIFYDIDTPITIARLRSHGATEYLDPALIPSYSAYLSFAGGPLLREIQGRFGSPEAIPFYCSVDPDLHRPTDVNERYRCELSYLGTYAEDRQPALMRMLNEPAGQMPKSRFIVAGPMYPKTIPWKKNVKRIIHLSPSEHPSLYCSSRFTLNLTRNDMVASGYAPSVRLFEAAACGAVILSDWWAGLDQFLTPARELLLVHDTCDVTQILHSMTDAERVCMGKAARERILAHHTSQHRAMQFEEIVARCRTPRRVPDQADEGTTRHRDSEIPQQAVPAGALPLPQR
ncbi:MAG TPA: glycosyltransferase [Terracidiphilus sp.]|nr:glycosyltransferase [Terracidiphilus sp.]